MDFRYLAYRQPCLRVGLSRHFQAFGLCWPRYFVVATSLTFIQGWVRYKEICENVRIRNFNDLVHHLSSDVSYIKLSRN